MTKLTVTLIDVGWGDSLLIEATDDHDETHYGLVDSNDTATLRSSFIFLKRHFEKAGIHLPGGKPVFDFVLLSHPHADHGQGLKAIMKYFGTKRFWYPKSTTWASLSSLIDYANRSRNVEFHQSIDRTKQLPDLGSVQMKVLWPPRNWIDHDNENNNSIVLQLRQDDVSFVLTGDAEDAVWEAVADEIPDSTQFFKVPHHGSENGSFLDNGQPAWIHDCPEEAVLGISSHVRPWRHPHRRVLKLFNDENRSYLRTDENYHISFSTDGQTTSVRYFH
jgi:beta-lactamase superfamily II metal-dependent hydrolase